MQGKKTSRGFKAGEKAYLWKIGMDGDDLNLFLVSYETYAASESGGRTTQTRYKALLDFKFAKDYLVTAEWAQVKSAIAQIIVPEDEAKAANTKTISLGQTPAQVEGVLGKPDKIVNLGSKITYVYKDMKVLFVDGKVSDVQ